MAGLAALSVLSTVQQQVRSRHDDDFVDRLHYIAAPTLLLSLAGLHGLKQFFGRPVQCWPPAEMARGQWLNYIHGFCFVEDTYFVGFKEHFPIRRIDRDQRELHYYQWVPFVLMAQALLLILPKAIWILFIQKNGFSVSYLMEKLAKNERKNGNLIDRTELEKFAVRVAKDRRDQLCFRRGVNFGVGIDDALAGKDGSSQSLRNTFSELTWRMNDQKLSLGYIAYKMTNLVIVLLQLYVLNSCLGSSDHGRHSPWGLTVLSDLMAGRDWRESGLFPRVTFCDLLIRAPQRDMKPTRYTFQCLLNMNMFNEKIFLFLWCALIALTLADTFNLALWFHRCFSWRSAQNFVRDELLKVQTDAATESNNFRGFVKYSLGRDTVTLLRLINANCLPLTSAKMVGQLWHYHKKGYIGFKSARSMGDPTLFC